MTPINNMSTYTKEMSKTIEDKCWWVNYMPFDINIVIDFGCAHGDLGVYLNEKYPGRFRYIGVDNSKEMADYAKAQGLEIYSSLSEIQNCDFNSSVLVMNSVVHELFSYCTGIQINSFFNAVRQLQPCFIAIRDMYLYHYQAFNFNIIKAAYAIHESDKYKNQWYEYLNNYNYHLDPDAAVIEFLLKYRYQVNWEREKQERYLWDWLPYFQNLEEYTIKVDQPFYIPFIKDQVKKDFGITLNGNTHRKILLSLK